MKITTLINIFFRFVNENRSNVHKVFWICIFIGILKGWVWGGPSDTYFLEVFFNDRSDLLFHFFKLFYSKPGLLIMALTSFYLFLWLLYILSSANKKISFPEFILPFLGLAVIGFPLHGLGIIFHLINVPVPPFLVLIIVIFILIFYCFILNREFEVSLIRSISVIVALLLPILILGGLPGFAPYLIWL